MVVDALHVALWTYIFAAETLTPISPFFPRSSSPPRLSGSGFRARRSRGDLCLAVVVAATGISGVREYVQKARCSQLRPSRQPNQVGTPSNRRHQPSSPPRPSPPLLSIRRLRASLEPAALPYRFLTP
ncbi:hypothetical protein ACQJBY_026557 [Aegilops geniculata]